MKAKLALCVLTLGIASSAFGAACVAGDTLAQYITAGSCTVGNYTFSNFTYLAVDVLAPGVTAADITVDPTVTGGEPDVTFTPDSSLQASGILISAADYIFGFEVTSDVPTIGFQSVDLTANGSTSGLLGLATVAEVDCYGGLLQVPNAVTGIVGVGCLNSGVAAGASVNLDENSVGPVDADIEFSEFSTTVDVLKDVTLVAGLDSSASITSIGQSFTTETGSTTPEPASFLLGGAGLIGLSLLRRRRPKGASFK